MSHLSVEVKALRTKTITSVKDVMTNEVTLIILPNYNHLGTITKNKSLIKKLDSILAKSGDMGTVLILSSTLFCAEFAQNIRDANLKLWVAIKTPKCESEGYLNLEHSSMLVYTKYHSALKHTKTRIGYSYCPTCDRTTKDYGGKKHLYHQYGTLMSDVWKDITVDLDEGIDHLYPRLSDIFGIEEYSTLQILDLRSQYPIKEAKRKFYFSNSNKEFNGTFESQLINGDCLTELRKLPTNSVDFAFADPPYNLNKKYESSDDAIDIQEYFSWCDEWLTEMARVVKPGRTVAILNIPQWAVRHYRHLSNILDYQDWIVWEGLSMPVRMIMPAHYSILCFSKGKPRSLPLFNRNFLDSGENDSTTTIKSDYCRRISCIKSRRKLGTNDNETISNLWWDIHRLKHNSRRLDHPCQLPPVFMKRLISMFTEYGEIVLDPFNGIGTSSLCADMMGRKYIGIELSNYYHDITFKRHEEIKSGIDPFRKQNTPGKKAKNSPVARLKEQKYEVSKKQLQMDVKAIAKKLGHIPSKEEVAKYSKHPIEYFENYFINWGEVTAAARTTGMTEIRQE